MKITVWSLTVEYYDQTDTSVHKDSIDAHWALRNRFAHNHTIWYDGDCESPLEMTAEQMDKLTHAEFRELLVDYGGFHSIEHHELEL